MKKKGMKEDVRKEELMNKSIHSELREREIERESEIERERERERERQRKKRKFILKGKTEGRKKSGRKKT